MEGARLHVAHWPDSLPFLHIMVSDDWRTAAELRSLVKQTTSVPGISTPPPPAATVQPPLPSAPAKADTVPAEPDPAAGAGQPPAALPQPAPPQLDRIALGIRIKKLRALGNSPQEIRAVLTQAEKDPERVQAILGIIAHMEHQEQTRQSTKLAWSLGILMVIVILLVGAGFILKDRFLNQNQPVAASAAGPALPPTQAPNPAAKILNLNTPVVNYGAVPPGASSASAGGCPRNAQEAADLFGGRPADWYYPPNSKGWVMARMGSSTSIFVPKGMTAAYLQLSNRLDLKEIKGPATMGDAYYVAISCP